MSRKYHMCLNISGALKNIKNMKGTMTDENGIALTISEIRMFLLSEQEKGHKVVPCSECDNFDYERGCQGHDEPGLRDE